MNQYCFIPKRHLMTLILSLLRIAFLIIAGFFLFVWSMVVYAGEKGSIPEEPMLDNAPTTSVFEAAVASYRKGRYGEAQRVFAGLHRQYPEQIKTTYYLAITEAQLGRFQAARHDYEEILKLDPHSEEGVLAQDGLKYLPPEDHLDLPPHFQQANEGPVAASQGNLIPGGASSGSFPANPGMPSTGSLPLNSNGIPSQDLMALQMMMGQNNGNSNGNNWSAMLSGLANPTPGSQPDPSVMSTLMMEQMLQNFSFQNSSGGKNE